MAVVDTSVPHPTNASEQANAASPEIRHAFPCNPSAVGDARHFVADLVGDQADRDTVALLVSELATNAILHARTPFEVGVTAIADGLRVEVRDRDTSPLVPPTLAPGDQESGRGLFIVASVAHVWGYTANPSGKAVWFELTKAR